MLFKLTLIPQNLKDELAEVALMVFASYDRPERLRKDRRSLKATVGSISSSSLSSSFGEFPGPGSLITGFTFSQGFKSRGETAQGPHLNAFNNSSLTGGGSTIMAPISTDLLGWAISEQPGAAFLSITILFIVSIALLALCMSCKKHSFELENSSAPEQKSSTLVSVARKDDSTGARHNPAANEITGDEIGLDAEAVTISQGGITYKPWRSHTLTHGSNLPTQINGSVGTTNEGSVSLHAN